MNVIVSFLTHYPIITHYHFSRLREEIEKQAAEHNRKIIELEKAKSGIVTAYERKLADADREHLETIERLKETHR